MTQHPPPLPEPLGYAHINIAVYGVGDWFAIRRNPKTVNDIGLYTDEQLQQYALAAYQAGFNEALEQVKARIGAMQNMDKL